MKNRWLLVSHAHLGYYWFDCVRTRAAPIGRETPRNYVSVTGVRDPTSTRDTTCCLFDTPPNSRNCTENIQFSSPLKMDQLFCIP